jgi:ATP-dependent exoDNAse (exonuclease V) beta subunit
MIVESLNAEHLNLLNEPYIPLPTHTLSLLDGEQMQETSVQYNIPIIRALEQLSSQPLQTEPSEANNMTNALTNTNTNIQTNTVTIPQRFSTEELPPMLLGTLETSVEGDYYSASQLQLFERDAEEYERLYRLGLPPADDDGFIVGRASGVEDDSDATIGTSAGECIHAVLEHLPLWMNTEGVFLANEYQRVVERVLPQKMAFIPSDLLARIQRETQAVAATPLVKRFASEVNAAKFEFSITLPVGNDFLIGSIDVLLNQTDGEVEIWDWKTNRVGSARDMDTLLKHYRLQLEVYAFVVSHLHPEQQTFRTRLLFTRRATATAADEDWTRVLEFTRLDIQAIEEKIRRLIGKIRLQSYGIE